MSDTEYISKDAFIAQQRKQYCVNCERRKGTKNGERIFVYEVGEAPCRACDIEDMINAMWDFIAADVTPVVHGYWEPPHFDYHWYKAHCSVCGHADERSGGDKHTMENYKMPKICENCGAIMDLKPYNEWIPMSYGRFKWNGGASENER